MAYHSVVKQDASIAPSKSFYLCLVKGCGEMTEGIESMVIKYCDLHKTKAQRDSFNEIIENETNS